MSFTDRVCEGLEPWERRVVLENREVRRVLILDWFYRQGWITDEERLMMSIHDLMKQYRREKARAAQTG